MTIGMQNSKSASGSLMRSSEVVTHPLCLPLEPLANLQVELWVVRHRATDGRCDALCASAACGYDGGDCCTATVSESGGAVACGTLRGDGTCQPSQPPWSRLPRRSLPWRRPAARGRSI